MYFYVSAMFFQSNHAFFKSFSNFFRHATTLILETQTNLSGADLSLSCGLQVEVEEAEGVAVCS